MDNPFLSARNNNTATTKRPTARDIFSSLSEPNAAYENTKIETKIEKTSETNKTNQSRFITKPVTLDQSETATPESIARAVLDDIIDEMFVRPVLVLENVEFNRTSETVTELPEALDFEPLEIIDEDDVFQAPREG